MADSFRIPDFGRISGLLSVVALMIATVSGCSPCRSTLTAFSPSNCQLKAACGEERRAHALAKAVWNEKFADNYCDHNDVEGVRAGFVDGFVAICMGSGDCPPMFAPNQNGMFQHGENTCATAWHNGYPMGAAEAAACGCQVQNCARVHPCLRDVRRPVNPGCIRVSEHHLLSDNSVDKSPSLLAAEAAATDGDLNLSMLSSLSKVDPPEFGTTEVIARSIPELELPGEGPEAEDAISQIGFWGPELFQADAALATEQCDSKTVEISLEASCPVIRTDVSSSDGWRPTVKRHR